MNHAWLTLFLLSTWPQSALHGIPRRVAVAGGQRKHSALRGALLGHWVNVLIADIDVARRLLDSPSGISA